MIITISDHTKLVISYKNIYGLGNGTINNITKDIHFTSEEDYSNSAAMLQIIIYMITF
jgi:hypothetical protein